MLFRLINIILERTSHGPQRKHLLVFFLITQHKHSICIVVPMTGNFIQIRFCHQRRLGADISPFIVFQVFNPALHGLNHLSPPRHKQRESLSDDIHCRKQFHLSAQLIMISLLNIFKMFQICMKFVLCGKSCSINSLELRPVRISTPIRHRRRNQFKCFDGLGTDQMRSCTQICKSLSLFVKGNFCILWQVLYQLHLIRFLPFLHKLYCLFPWKCKLLKTISFFNNLFHFFFQSVKIFPGKWFCLKIIIKSFIYGRPNSKPGIWKQPFDRFCEYMGASMADSAYPFYIFLS